MCIDPIYSYVGFSVGGTNSSEAPEVQDKLVGKKNKLIYPAFVYSVQKYHPFQNRGGWVWVTNSSLAGDWSSWEMIPY